MALKRILLVDDEIAVLFAYKKVLQRPGVVVDSADSKAETLRLIRNQHYDVAILDLRLGGGTCEEGFALIEAIKASSPGTSIMLITAYGNQETREKASRLGAEFYFEKPVSTKFVQEALRLSGVLINEDEVSNVLWKMS